MDSERPVAVIVGSSSGIGEALARQLAAEGWRLGLLARRVERLQGLAADLGEGTEIRALDIGNAGRARVEFEAFLAALGRVDLIVISAGTGHLNNELAWAPDDETIRVNALGFAAIAQASMRFFLAAGRGHLVGISSVAKLRANGGGAAYCASKAFVSSYLDGLRDLARHHGKTIHVTEACPGFVATDMLKASKPFWVASPERAAQCIRRAIQQRARHVYVTRRWGLIGAVLKLLPAPG
jgi:Short-chain dehydrogenases of various substrate specificities